MQSSESSPIGRQRLSHVRAPGLRKKGVTALGTHLLRGIPIVIVAGLVLALVRFGGGGERASGHSITATPGVPQFHVEIDVVQDGSTFCEPVDASVHSVGSTYRVAVCVKDPPVAIGSFSFELVYDDTLNRAPEVADSGMGLDDNPDANAGTTTWPNSTTDDDLGGSWDCSGFGNFYPKGDIDPATGPGHGRARIVCISLEGPSTLGDNETEGTLATVRFNVIGTGPDTLHLENVYVADKDGAEIGSCNPAILVPIPCFDATDDKTAPTPAAVGGIAELPDVAGTPVQTGGSSGPGPGALARMAAAIATGALALGGAAWYGRRRWLR
jgi:hypothetical protein